MTKTYKVRAEKMEMYEDIAQEISEQYGCEYLAILGILHQLDRKIQQEVRMD